MLHNRATRLPLSMVMIRAKETFCRASTCTSSFPMLHHHSLSKGKSYQYAYPYDTDSFSSSKSRQIIQRQENGKYTLQLNSLRRHRSSFSQSSVFNANKPISSNAGGNMNVNDYNQMQNEFQRTFLTYSPQTAKTQRENVNIKDEFREHFQKGNPDDAFYAMRNPQGRKRPKVQHKIEKALGIITLMSAALILYMMVYWETRQWRDDVNRLPPREKKSDVSSSSKPPQTD